MSLPAAGEDRQLAYAMSESRRLAGRREVARRKKIEKEMERAIANEVARINTVHDQVEDAAIAGMDKTCDICSWRIKTCVLLMKDESNPCRHGYCRPCVQEMIDTQFSNGQSMKCPNMCGDCKSPLYHNFWHYTPSMMDAGSEGVWMVTDGNTPGAGGSSDPLVVGSSSNDATAQAASAAAQAVQDADVVAVTNVITEIVASIAQQQEIVANHAQAVAAYTAAEAALSDASQ